MKRLKVNTYPCLSMFTQTKTQVNFNTDTQHVISYIFSKLSAQLKPIYTYHALSHTTMVLRDATFIATRMNVSQADLNLLQIAICMHDYGFVKSHENHEETGCLIAREMLPAFGLNEEQLDKICGMIMATKIPQSPKNDLERIICDADLFYLGTNYYFQVADLFKKELKGLGILTSEEQWMEIQIKFLENHKYHTQFAKNLLESHKQQNLSILKSAN